MSTITVSSAVSTPYSTPGWNGQPGSQACCTGGRVDTIFGSSVEASPATPVAAIPNRDPSPVGSGSTTYSEAHRKTVYAGTTPADGGLLLEYLRATREEGLLQQRYQDDQ